ncbi:MAG: TPM domain-containing protein [Sandarakinorhabdus sp.]|nr:TPM domain-containing protein [Sandarakinorhabdus sp.]
MTRGSDDRLTQRLSLIALILAALVLVISLAAPAFAAPTFPKLDGRVTDAAGILTPETRASLDTKLAALEKTTTIQLVVATVPDLQGYEIDEYGYQLGRAWGIGQKGSNNGALLIVAPNEKKVRIEVGYGLEGVLTDALTSQIIRRNIIPSFKAGDMAGGVIAGTDALTALMQLPADQRQQAAMAAAASERQGAQRSRSSGFGTIVWLVIIVVWLIIAIARHRPGRRSGPNVIWGPGLGGGGGWGGGGGGWGGGGGGFGGGGGGFGGGGSSGGW